MVVTPSYWHSWKGKILRAISIDGARTWNDIQQKSGLEPDDLNTALSELYELNYIIKEGDSYKILSNSLRKEYSEYDAYLKKGSKSNRVSTPEQVQKVRIWLKKYKAYKEDKKIEGTIIEKLFNMCFLNLNVEFPFTSEHIFLNDDNLDRISKDLISSSKNQVFVVNPFVDECSLSDKLKEVSGLCSVKLLTRNPDSDRETYSQASRIKCHSALKMNNVEIRYNDRIHSKLILIDDLVAVVSSMNLYSGSTGGKSKEAGIVTWEKSNIESIKQYIYSNWNESEIV